MARADQIKALIASHTEGDDERFYAIALQLAARAARQGQNRFAQDLKDLIDQAKGRREKSERKQQVRPVPVVQPRGELAGLLSVTYPRLRLSTMALEPSLQSKLEKVLLEQRRRDRLQEHNLSPARKLLLTGKPGTGKTMTASVLACELGIPLFSIRLDGLITKYLGETAAKLRLIFDAIQETRGVYLFDEFDSLGSERATKNEVGEIRRVLNSFLQFLESDTGDSLVVAATNHPGLLDKALFRRFDMVIEYGLPTREVVEQIIENRLAFLGPQRIQWSLVLSAAEGLSHGDIAQASDQAAKQAILHDRTAIDTADLVVALKDRRSHQQE